MAAPGPFKIGFDLSAGGSRVVSPTQGGGAPVGPYPAPSGYRWGYVTENSQPVTENGERTVELERIAA